MADTLAAIAARSLSDPMGDPFLNRERADRLQLQLGFGASGPSSLNQRHRIADERLRAGQTREAIDALEQVMRDAGLADTAITEQNKPFFDLLALAYMRLGEQENCVGDAAANVCILPLAGGARHARQEGARGAIARFSEILRHFPDDYGTRWLLNIAYLQLGTYPDSVPAAWRIPGLALSPSDHFPTFSNVARRVGAAVEGRAGGLAIADYDGDGLLDLFITGWGITDQPHLMMADGRGGYVDRTERAGLRGIVGGLSAIHADFDNDGDEDVFVMRGAWLGEAGKYPNSLLRNDGHGRFEDVTFAAGLATFHPTQSAAWADFDGDGWLDLFVGNESWSKSLGGPPHPSELWHNNHDGTFTEVSAKVGIVLDDFVKGVTWGDVNGDGLPDVYVSVIYGRNRLYVNRGGTSIDDWKFEEHAEAAGVTLPINSFPAWFWDYDDDGWDDLLVLSYDVNSPMHEMVARERLGLPLATTVNGKRVVAESSRLYRNRHDGTFADVSRESGLATKAIYAMGSNFGDLDDDGWLDFYVGTGNPELRSVVPNRMFHSVGGRRFEEVTLPGGFGHLQKGHAAAFADLDRDGDEDVYMRIGGAYQGDRSTSVLFENPGWPGRHWITLRLEGRTANRSAIGARVELDVTDDAGHSRTLHRTVGTGGSFGTGPLELHVGLGAATKVRALRIRWPDRARSAQSAANLEVDRYYHIVQGEAPVLLDRKPVPFMNGPVTPAAHEHGVTP